MKKAALHNLGCKVNAYETDAMEQLLSEAGYTIVHIEETADEYVNNTCAVTHIADSKSRQMLHKAKKQNPAAIVVAAGCYVQTSAEEAALDASIDILLGNNEKHKLLSLIDECREKRRSAVEEIAQTTALLDINHCRAPYEELKVSNPTEHTRAILKEQAGCNQISSYCNKPYARGRNRRRALADVLEETRTLAANGFQEIVLTGIHLSSYGAENGGSLLTLIQSIAEIDGIARIRLGSLEPGIITEEFVAAIFSIKKVCPHFHLSLQSGSNSVLRRMNRKYTVEEYAEKCALLRRFYDHPAITTDVIVGFPGETQEEFEESCAFVQAIGFYEVHVFPYSRRDGTAAAKMPNQLPNRLKQERARGLLQLSEALKEEFLSFYDGKEVEVLFEEAREKDGKTYFSGFTPEYVKVTVQSGEPLENCIRTVAFLRHIV